MSLTETGSGDHCSPAYNAPVRNEYRATRFYCGGRDTDIYASMNVVPELGMTCVKYVCIRVPFVGGGSVDSYHKCTLIVENARRLAECLRSMCRKYLRVFVLP